MADEPEEDFLSDAEEIETMMEDCSLQPSNTIQELMDALNKLEDDDV
jgi:hypothetical protein